MIYCDVNDNGLIKKFRKSNCNVILHTVIRSLMEEKQTAILRLAFMIEYSLCYSSRMSIKKHEITKRKKTTVFPLEEK